jgi:OmpA-OmpF porin, OOP family
MKYLLLATSLLALPLAARAQPIDGLYVGAGAGANFMQPETQEEDTHVSAFRVPFSNFTLPGGNFFDKSAHSFDTGAVGVASVGYGFGNGLRIEAEGDYRYNAVNLGFDSNRTLREQKFGGMVNALFDLDIGSPYVFPYAGGGAGYMWIDRTVSGTQLGSFAYQGIAGVAFPIPWVAGLSATLEYRFMGVAGTQNTQYTGASAAFSAVNSVEKDYNDFNHSLLVGVRYAFNTPGPTLPAPVVPVPVQQVQPARTYLVFFDWDRADLTDRARQIVAEAAQASTRVQTTRIEVQGNADRSGTPAYNQKLSLRRAQTVAAELVRLGVPRTAIDIQAFGDTRPLVPTAPGVREPQNRRVAIVLR